MKLKRILVSGIVVALGMLGATAGAVDSQQADLIAQFKAAGPDQRVVLARELGAHDSPDMVAALLPLVRSNDAELRADTLFTLATFDSDSLGAAAPALIEALGHDTNWRARANAAYTLIKLPNTQGAVATFSTCARDPDSRVRTICAKGLGAAAAAQHAGDVKVLSVLTTDLGDRYRLVRFGAAVGLRTLASTDPMVIHALAAQLDVEFDPWVRGAIANALAAAGPAAEPALSSLARAIFTPQAQSTRQVFTALAAIGAPAVPFLITTMGDGARFGKDHTFVVANYATEALVGLDAPMVDALGTALQSGPALQRRNAAIVLGRHSAEAAAAVPLLVAALQDDDAGVRREAATSLGKLASASDNAVSPLVEVVDDPDPAVRAAAIESLQQGLQGFAFGRSHATLSAPMAARLATLLGARLADKDDDVAASAADTLAELGPQAAPALAPLRSALLTARDNDTAAKVAYALAAIGNAGIPVLIEAVHQHMPASSGTDAKDSRGVAAIQLGTLGRAGKLGAYKDKAAMALTEALSDPRSDVRAQAAMALQGVGVSPIGPLEDKLKQGTPAERTDAATALGTFREDAAHVVPVLTTALTDPEHAVRVAAARSLASPNFLNVDAAASALLGALESNDDAVRAVAAEALDKAWLLNENMAPAIANALGKHLGDPDKAVREATIKALTLMAVAKKPLAMPLVPALTAAVRQQTPDVHAQAAMALARLDKPGLDALIAMLQQEASQGGKPRGRLDAAQALVEAIQIANPPAPERESLADACIEALRDPLPEVRAAVAQTLYALHASATAAPIRAKVINALEAAAQRESDDDAKQAMQSALENWGAGS